jgi:Txe/YoeB family toxin of Txe-Axe toxin-antitoxin module
VDVAKKIGYGSHAEEKFEILRRHGFVVSKRQVRETLQRPEKTEEGFRGRNVAQRRISEKHVLRVVYEEGQREIRVVTCYPGRRSRYESSI